VRRHRRRPFFKEQLRFARDLIGAGMMAGDVDMQFP
jgi:hypothetical protein